MKYRKSITSDKFEMNADKDNKNEIIVIKDIKQAIESIKFIADKIEAIIIEVSNINGHRNDYIKGELIELGVNTITISETNEQILKIKKINDIYKFRNSEDIMQIENKITNVTIEFNLEV